MASRLSSSPLDPLRAPARGLRRAIIRQVRAVFHDSARGEAPIVRQPDGLFGPQSVAWRVHGDVTTMMAGGVAALLLQMLHPAVLAGVWDHSNFREDMLGRLRRTARFIAVTTYGSRADAEAVIDRVRSIHNKVSGVLPDGQAYAAEDPRLLSWVHVSETICFLDAWIRYAEPAMPMADQDRYFAEMAQIGAALGAAPVPRCRAEAEGLVADLRPELRSDARTREVAKIVLGQRARVRATEPVQQLTFGAAIDLLPAWAREMHGISVPPAARPFVRAGTWAMAGTLRWAFR